MRGLFSPPAPLFPARGFSSRVQDDVPDLYLEKWLATIPSHPLCFVRVIFPPNRFITKEVRTLLPLSSVLNVIRDNYCSKPLDDVMQSQLLPPSQFVPPPFSACLFRNSSRTLARTRPLFFPLNDFPLPPSPTLQSFIGTTRRPRSALQARKTARAASVLWLFFSTQRSDFLPSESSTRVKRPLNSSSCSVPLCQQGPGLSPSPPPERISRRRGLP